MPTTKGAKPTTTAKPATSAKPAKSAKLAPPAVSMMTESQEAKRERLGQIVTILKTTYPDAHCSLDFTTPFQLLVATILAAQCTDERVNATTKTLFVKYPTVEDVANADPDEFEQEVKHILFFRNKAKNIRATARILLDRYHGEVPSTIAEIAALPGAARKTANVVLGNAMGVVEGIAVDTHVGRLTRRMGITQSEDPVVIEQELLALVPRDDWVVFTHLLIYHGRAVCQSRKPLCAECGVASLCPTGKSELGL